MKIIHLSGLFDNIWHEIRLFAYAIYNLIILY